VSDAVTLIHLIQIIEYVTYFSTQRPNINYYPIHVGHPSLQSLIFILHHLTLI